MIMVSTPLGIVAEVQTMWWLDKGRFSTIQASPYDKGYNGEPITVLVEWDEDKFRTGATFRIEELTVIRHNLPEREINRLTGWGLKL